MRVPDVGVVDFSHCPMQTAGRSEIDVEYPRHLGSVLSSLLMSHVLLLRTELASVVQSCLIATIQGHREVVLSLV